MDITIEIVQKLLIINAHGSNVTRLQLLGTAQDGGIPHTGCICSVCRDPKYHRLVASLAIFDQSVTMIDATPDFTRQERAIGTSNGLSIDRIFISHLHIGHYTGLLQLGKEGFSSSNFPIFVSKSVDTYLNQNKPFSYLISRQQINLHHFNNGEAISIGNSTGIEPIEVPHRNEDGDTHGFIIRNTESKRSCLYIPDIDYLGEDIIKIIRNCDIIIFDGSFWEKNELQRQKEIPHPPIIEVINLVGNLRDGQRFVFTHFNHTNPVLHEKSLQQLITTKGYEIGYDGMTLKL